MPPIPPPPSPSGASTAVRVLVIGIGAGDPEHLTLAAVRALNTADAVFVVEKGPAGAALRDARVELCRRVIEPSHTWRLVEVELRGVADRDGGDYPGAIAAWRDERAQAYEGLVAGLQPGETGAFLVWGDPALYDGTIAVLDEVRAAGRVAFEVEVVPGITAASALAARHGTTLNRAGEAVLVTTGRRLVRDGWPAGVDNVVVLLDTHDALHHVDDDLEIWWGAFLGLEGERLVAGTVGDRRAVIERERARAREEHGWLFDTYLLRRRR